MAGIESFFLQDHLTNVEGIMELEYHSLATIMVIIQGTAIDAV